MDDIIVFGTNQEDHHERLIATLKRLQQAGVTLNSEKCEFNKSSIRFLGHVIDKDGVRADPPKTSTIAKMPTPQSLTELRRFMGMANQLGNFSSKIADIGQPLRELMSAKRTWIWGAAQENAFKQIKEKLIKPTVLVLYDPNAQTKVSADTSSYGLGAVLLQNKEGIWKPVDASRTLSETERCYAQIEKVALAVTWACEKFADYILGCSFAIETDHKPLVPLLNSKCLNMLPPRILRFRLRLTRFDYVVSHVPGKQLYTADTLSRAPNDDDSIQPHLQVITDLYIKEVLIPSFPACQITVEMYKQAQRQDPGCSLIIDAIQDGQQTIQLHHSICDHIGRLEAISQYVMVYCCTGAGLWYQPVRGVKQWRKSIRAIRA